MRLFIDENGNINSAIQDVQPDDEIDRLIHATAKNITEDIESHDLKFNTCVSEMMIFMNEISKQEVYPRSVMEKFVKLLSPFAPHLAEEIWSRLGHTNTISYEPWPTYDESKLKRNVVTVVGQINGKLRAKVEVESDLPEDRLIEALKQNDKMKSYIDGKEIVKEIAVKNKLVNIVVK
jgi:leucyl-tRNA synthetase